MGFFREIRVAMALHQEEAQTTGSPPSTAAEPRPHRNHKSDFLRRPHSCTTDKLSSLDPLRHHMPGNTPLRLANTNRTNLTWALLAIGPSIVIAAAARRNKAGSLRRQRIAEDGGLSHQPVARETPQEITLVTQPWSGSSLAGPEQSRTRFSARAGRLRNPSDGTPRGRCARFRRETSHQSNVLRH